MFVRNRIVVPAVADNGASECLRKFRARLGYFSDGLGASRIMIAGMNAVLIDRRSRAQDAERVEEMDLMTIFSQPDGSRRAVDAGSRYSDLRSHNFRPSFLSRERISSLND